MKNRFTACRLPDGVTSHDEHLTLASYKDPELRKEFMKGVYAKPYSRFSLLARLDIASLEYLIESNDRWHSILDILIPELANAHTLNELSLNRFESLCLYLDVPRSLWHKDFVELLFAENDANIERKIGYGTYRHETWFVESIIDDYPEKVEAEF